MVQVMFLVHPNLLLQLFPTSSMPHSSSSLATQHSRSELSAIVFLPQNQLEDAAISSDYNSSTTTVTAKNTTSVAASNPDTEEERSNLPRPHFQVIASINHQGMPIVVAILTNAWEVIHSIFTQRHLNSHFASTSASAPSSSTSPTLARSTLRVYQYLQSLFGQNSANTSSNATNSSMTTSSYTTKSECDEPQPETASAASASSSLETVDKAEKSPAVSVSDVINNNYDNSNSPVNTSSDSLSPSQPPAVRRRLIRDIAKDVYVQSSVAFL